MSIFNFRIHFQPIKGEFALLLCKQKNLTIEKMFIRKETVNNITDRFDNSYC